MMMSSLYIEQYSPPTCIAQQLIILLTCNHLRRPWRREQSRLLNLSINMSKITEISIGERFNIGFARDNGQVSR